MSDALLAFGRGPLQQYTIVAKSGLPCVHCFLLQAGFYSVVNLMSSVMIIHFNQWASELAQSAPRCTANAQL